MLKDKILSNVELSHSFVCISFILTCLFYFEVVQQELLGIKVWRTFFISDADSPALSKLCLAVCQCFS